MEGVDQFGRMTRKHVATALGYSEGTLANWVQAGIGPRVYRQRGKVYYLASEVRQFALGDALVA